MNQKIKSPNQKEINKNNSSKSVLISKKDFNVAFFLAIKNVMHKKKMLIFIIFIVGLGFLSTLFTSGMLDGFQYTLEDKVITTMFGNIILSPLDAEDSIKDSGYIIKFLKKINGVESVSSRISKGIVLVNSDGDKFAGNLIVVDPNKEKDTTIIDNSIIRGDFLSSGSRGEIIVGADVTKDYKTQDALDTIDVTIGDKVTAMIEDKITTVKIRGIYQSGFAMTDQFIFMNQEDIQEIFNMSKKDLDYVNMISIKTKRGMESEILRRIKESGIKGEFKHDTWEDKLGIVKQFEESISIISKIISGIGIFISLAIIYILILINVMQKRSQIGILKSIGIEGKTISLSYVIQSLIYGILGIVFGIFLTLFVVNYFKLNPLDTPMGKIYPIINSFSYVKSAIILIFASVFAGYYASKGVIKDKILEAIFNG